MRTKDLQGARDLHREVVRCQRPALLPLHFLGKVGHARTKLSNSPPGGGGTNPNQTPVNHKASEERRSSGGFRPKMRWPSREIVDRYQGKVFSIINGILRNRNDAEDIAQQNVREDLLFPSATSIPCSSLLTWIYRITVNECYDYLRKRQVRKLVYESDFSAEEVRSLETSNAVVDPDTPVDHRVAQHDSWW